MRWPQSEVSGSGRRGGRRSLVIVDVVVVVVILIGKPHVGIQPHTADVQENDVFIYSWEAPNRRFSHLSVT